MDSWTLWLKRYCSKSTYQTTFQSTISKIIKYDHSKSSFLYSGSTNCQPNQNAEGNSWNYKPLRSEVKPIIITRLLRTHSYNSNQTLKARCWRTPEQRSKMLAYSRAKGKAANKLIMIRFLLENDGWSKVKAPTKSNPLSTSTSTWASKFRQNATITAQSQKLDRTEGGRS